MIVAAINGVIAGAICRLVRVSGPRPANLPAASLILLVLAMPRIGSLIHSDLSPIFLFINQICAFAR